MPLRMGTHTWWRESLTKRSPHFTKPASWIRSVPMSPRGSPKWNGGNTQRARRCPPTDHPDPRAETLHGEGARRRLVMEADGALEKKLQAYIEVSKLYAS